MSVIALDATYAADPQPSGVAVYSRRLIEALGGLGLSRRFLLCYRLSRYRRREEYRRLAAAQGPNFRARAYQTGLTWWLPWQAELFHSLAQRPPAFRFRREVVTVFDVFPLTGRDYSTPEFQRKFSALLLAAVGRAQRVIASSRATADQLVSLAGVPPEKLRVIPLGVELPAGLLSPEERARERAKLVGEGNELVLGVGVLQTRKNTLNAMRALASLPARYRLVWAGGDGHGSDAIHAFVRQERLGERVKLLGYVPEDQLPQLYPAASVLLFPSLEEGFGLPILEAMACGVPVVTSNVSSMPEVGGDAALYADPLDPGELAAQVLRAVENPEVRRRLIDRGLARAREFTWRRTAERTCAVYEELLAL